MKLTAFIISNSKRALTGPCSRAFVTSSKPLQKEVSDEKKEERKERFDRTAEKVNKGMEEVTKTVQTVREKVDSISDKAIDTALEAAKEKYAGK